MWVFDPTGAQANVGTVKARVQTGGGAWRRAAPSVHARPRRSRAAWCTGKPPAMPATHPSHASTACGTQSTATPTPRSSTRYAAPFCAFRNTSVARPGEPPTNRKHLEPAGPEPDFGAQVAVRLLGEVDPERDRDPVAVNRLEDRRPRRRRADLRCGRLRPAASLPRCPRAPLPMSNAARRTTLPAIAADPPLTVGL